MQQFFIWRDAIEILFFSNLFYYLMRWLAKDRTKNLLPYFYGYCLTIIAAYALQLTIISSLLFLYSPAIIMLFIFMHQETLQRNLIALNNIQPIKKDNQDWLNILFRSCLVMMNKHKTIMCLLECNDNLNDLINTPFPINADLHQEVLALLLNSQAYESDKLLWVNTQGKLRALNAHWYSPSQTSAKTQQTYSWQQKSIFYTQQTDALIFYSDILTHTFTIIARGKYFEKISPPHTLDFIKKHINAHPIQKKDTKKGKDNVQNRAKKNFFSQRSP